MTKKRKRAKKRRSYEAKWLPSPQEIADEAKKIREENEASMKVSTTNHESHPTQFIKIPKVYKTPNFGN
jgi:hypothetical protein